MGCRPKITPFMKQCFAVSSVALNMVSYGLTFGYNATLFTELRKTKEIPLDVDSESWLASLIGLTLCLGSIISSLIMEIIGRKPAIIVSSVFTICGWIAFSLASSFPVLLIGKIVQGIAAGIGSTMSCILVAEYSSPKYRGPFISTIPPANLLGTFIAHAFGMSYGWHDLSTILIFFSIPGLVVAAFSPESPSFLLKKKRYDESREVFRWLRGSDEDNEIEQMIKTDIILRETRKNRKLEILKQIKDKLLYIFAALRKRECRRSIIIMIHLSAITHFTGAIATDMYPLDFHKALYGTDAYIFKVITSLDLLRIISTFSAIYVTSKLKRRSILLIFVGLIVLINLAIGGYIYAKKNGLLPFDHMAVALLLHILYTFIIGAGCLPLFFIINGEIFPLADKGLCATISNGIYALFMFINVKSAPYLFSLMGIDGTFCFYALIVGYGLVVTYVLLPETKGKTLQEIEDKLRGYAIVNEEETVDLKDNENLN